MAERTISTFTVNMIIIGLALLSMLSTYVLMVNNEGQGEIFDDYPEISEFNLNLSNSFQGDVVNTANTNINLSAKYNPELAISAADQSGNAMALNLQTLFTLMFSFISVFFGLVFGNIWIVLSGLVGSIIAFIYTYRFISWIRSGR